MTELAFNGTVLEGRERRYTIINERDYQTHIHHHLKQKFEEVLAEVQTEIELCRELLGKQPFNSYIVVNVDEPYVEEIIEVMKKHGHWEVEKDG